MFKKKQPNEFTIKEAVENLAVQEVEVVASDAEVKGELVTADQASAPTPLLPAEPTLLSATSRPPLSLSFASRLLLLARRLIASAIDQLICLPVTALIFAPSTFLWFYMQCGAPMAVSQIASPFFLAGLLATFWVATYFQSFYYCAKFESSAWQATPGKRLVGLQVTGMAGEKMTFKQVFERLTTQGLIIGGIGYGCSLIKHFLFPDVQLDVFYMSLIGCFVFSLFNRRGQTLFDLCAHRIVAVEKYKATNLNWAADIKQAISILLEQLQSKTQWKILFCLVICNLVLSFPAVAIVTFGLNEANHAPWQSGSRAEIQLDEHYIKAKQFLRNPGSFYFALNTLRQYAGLTPSLEDFEKAALSYPGWTAHYEYALELEKLGQYKKALIEVECALLIRANPYDPDRQALPGEMIEKLTRVKKDESPFDRFMDGKRTQNVSEEQMRVKEENLKKLIAQSKLQK